MSTLPEPGNAKTHFVRPRDRGDRAAVSNMTRTMPMIAFEEITIVLFCAINSFLWGRFCFLT